MTCGCGPAWQKPKPNATCATCGGWLPGEEPDPLPWTMPERVVHNDIAERLRREAHALEGRR